MLSMASALEKTKKTRCRVYVEVVTTSTLIIIIDYLKFELSQLITITDCRDWNELSQQINNELINLNSHWNELKRKRTLFVDEIARENDPPSRWCDRGKTIWGVSKDTRSSDLSRKVFVRKVREISIADNRSISISVVRKRC